MEDESVEMLEVAEPTEVVEQSENTTQGVAEPEQQAEETKPVERDYERDSAFASLRRQLEQAQKEKVEAENNLQSVKSERERLANSLGLFGFTGNTDEIEDQAKAHYTGRDIADIRQERVLAQQKLAEQQARSNEIERLQNENKALIEQRNQRIFEDDLRKIQSINPNIKSLDELGDKWFALMRAGFTAEGAYRAVEVENNVDKKTPPPEIGKLNASTKSDKTYYTPEEVDALTSAQLDDPVIFANVRKSMTKWK